MTPEEIAQLHSERPGYTLASYGTVGLPIYRIEMHALVLDQKEIGPFDEFTLRAVATGITDSQRLCSLLGLDSSTLEATVVDLLSSDDLSVRREPGQSESGIHLTGKGRKTLESAQSVVPEEVLIEFDYDGLLRSPIPFVDNWVTSRVLRDTLGAREIPPSPSKPPQLEDVDIQAVRQIVRALADRRQAKRDLLAFRAINRRSLRFQPAVALVYQAEGSDDVQVAFAIDGRLSDEHEKAFARTRFKKRFAPNVAEAPSPEAIAAEILGEDLVRSSNRKQTLVLGKVAGLILPQEPKLDDSVAPAVDPAVVDAQRELATLPVRTLETYEHPAYLHQALTTAKERVVIISPWLRQAVVNDTFLQQLEGLLTRRVNVFLGWGISGPDGESDDGDYQVRQSLSRLAVGYATFRLKYLGDTHAKILLCDQQYVIVTSFNWLSYRGDPRRTFRDERGVLVAIPDVINQQFETLTARFQPRSPAA